MTAACLERVGLRVQLLSGAGAAALRALSGGLHSTMRFGVVPQPIGALAVMTDTAIMRHLITTILPGTSSQPATPSYVRAGRTAEPRLPPDLADHHWMELPSNCDINHPGQFSCVWRAITTEQVRSNWATVDDIAVWI